MYPLPPTGNKVCTYSVIGNGQGRPGGDPNVVDHRENTIRDHRERRKLSKRENNPQ